MRSRLAAVAFVAALTAAATTTTPAHADAHSDAVKAFEEGKKLRDANDLERALRAFERSIGIEPSIGAYYNLGIINAQLGRPREGVDALRKAERLAHDKGDNREKDAVEALQKVLDTHNHVILRVPAEVAAAPGLQVVVDGEVVPERHYDGEVFRAAPEHDVTVSAKGRRDVRLHARNKQVVEVVIGEAEHLAAAAAARPASPAASPPPPPREEPTSSSGGWGLQKWAGVSMVGAGLVGITVSLVRVFGYLGDESSLDDARRTAASGCTGAGGRVTACDGDPSSARIGPANAAIEAYDQNEQDAKDGAPLTVTLGVAGALLVGGGIALFATAPSSSPASAASSGAAPSARATASGLRVHVVPRLAPHESGLVVVGAF